MAVLEVAIGIEMEEEEDLEDGVVDLVVVVEVVILVVVIEMTMMDPLLHSEEVEGPTLAAAVEILITET
jgi:hypothetical protein